MRRAALLLVLACAAPQPATAQQPRERVDLELVLLADASSSIDDVENRLQRQGYAAAITDRQVLQAIEDGGELGRIAVAYVEWSGRRSQHMVAGWSVIDDASSAAAFAAELLSRPRQASGVNAIGAALLKGLELIEGNRFDGFRKVIDLSGDSIWNPRPPTIAQARDLALGRDVVINGLAVLCEGCSGRPGPGDLEAEFTDRLIVGPGAFVVTADGSGAFAQAVRRKLILEISGQPEGARLAGLSSLPTPSPVTSQ
jgi:Protein of unknown function (DUF1194)